jgi:hypothetical protein
MAAPKPTRKRAKLGLVHPNTIFPISSYVDGEWYATITAKLVDGDPVIAIAGPFADREEAQAYNSEYVEYCKRHGELRLINTRSVPAKARQSITDDVLRGWREGQFERLRSWPGGDDLPINLNPKN